jgi:hypothetical protein
VAHGREQGQRVDLGVRDVAVGELPTASGILITPAAPFGDDLTERVGDHRAHRRRPGQEALPGLLQRTLPSPIQFHTSILPDQPAQPGPATIQPGLRHA